MEQYLDEKRIEMEAIIENKDWALLDPLYQEMEKEGYGQYVPEISEMMSYEDILDYKKYDREINGSIETQMDDAS